MVNLRKSHSKSRKAFDLNDTNSCLVIQGNENQQSGKTENEQNDSEITIENPIKSNGATKRPITDDVDETVKRSKTDENNDHPHDSNNEVLPLNSRFEWYDEIKRVLSKADDQTLTIEVLKKKVNLT